MRSSRSSSLLRRPKLPWLDNGSASRGYGHPCRPGAMARLRLPALGHAGISYRQGTAGLRLYRAALVAHARALKPPRALFCEHLSAWDHGLAQPLFRLPFASRRRGKPLWQWVKRSSSRWASADKTVKFCLAYSAPAFSLSGWKSNTVCLSRSSITWV